MDSTPPIVVVIFVLEADPASQRLLKMWVDPFVRAEIDGGYPSLSRWRWKRPQRRNPWGVHGLFLEKSRHIARLYPYLKSSRKNEELSRFQEKVLKEDLG
jgi:hypothetical protein